MSGKRFRSSVAFKWMISYAVILFIPILVSAVIYVQTGSIVEHEIKRANHALLNQVKFIIDNDLLQTEKLANQLSIHDDIRKFLQAELESDAEQSFHTYKTKQELFRYRLYNDFIKNIYVYSNRQNAVLTPDTYAAGKLFYRMYHESESLSYDSWNQFVNERHIKDYRIIPTIDGGVKDTAALVQSLPIEKIDQPSGTLVMVLNNNRIQKILENIDWIRNGQVLILDANDRKIFYTENADIPLSVHFNEMEQKKDEPFFETVNGNKVMISHVSSDVVDWKYISMIPAEVFWERVEYIRNLNLLGLLACCLIGGGVIILFARRNYNPIKNLIRFLNGQVAVPEEKKQDEYELIRQYFIQTIREKNDINSQQLQQKMVLQKYFLARLMKGHVEAEHSLNEASKTYRLKWHSDDFAVMLFHIESDKVTTSELQLLQFICSNIVADLAKRQHALYFTDVDGTLAAVLNVHPAGLAGWKDDLEDGLEKAREFIEQKYHFHFATAISELQRGLEGVHQAFLQSLEALEYLLLLDEEKVVWYNDIKYANNDYYYTVNQEQILINLLKSGDFENARAVVTDVIRSSFGQEHSSMEMLKGAMIDLASTMMKLLQEYEKDGSVWEELRPVRRLLKCSTKYEMERELLHIFNDVCSFLEGKRTAVSNLGISEHVADFVRNNYSDPDLSVSSIGQHFSMTPQYMSRLFKEQNGKGLYEYICQIRIDQAKKLLLAGENIEDTAEKTGFASSSAFIRVFKKYEGITPGKYKSING